MLYLNILNLGLNKNCDNTSDSGISDTIKRPKLKAKSKKKFSKKSSRIDQEKRDEESCLQSVGNMCCSRKCFCVGLIAVFISMDILVNLFFVTESFKKTPDFSNYHINSSLIDVWFISMARDLVLFVVVTFVAIRHKFISGFVKFVHKKYISAFLCLMMYSFAMIKMLLHSDTRQVKQNNMFMLMWNVFAGFLFFISWYMLRLLKHKQSNYRKTDIDGGDLDENGNEEDIFIGNLFLSVSAIQCF